MDLFPITFTQNNNCNCVFSFLSYQLILLTPYVNIVFSYVGINHDVKYFFIFIIA